MAWRQLGDKPLPQAMLTNSQLDQKEHILMKLDFKTKSVNSLKFIWKFSLDNMGHFVTTPVFLEKIVVYANPW